MSDLRIGVSTEEAAAELNAVVSSSAFTRSPRLGRLLTYLCEKFLAGQADQIKEYSIGVEVLQRPPSFDPATDAGARVEVHRLRRRLRQFYEAEGAGRKIRIVIPVGHYVPAFVPNEPAEAKTAVHPAEESADEPAEVPFGLVADIVAREPESPPRNTLLIRSLGFGAALILVAGGLWIFKAPHGASRAEPAEAALTFAHAGVAMPAPPGNSIRIASGRTVPYTDRSGQTWEADRYFQGGTPFDSPRQFLSRAFDSRLFQSGRSGDFSYQIPLAKGVYELHLGFVESTYGPSSPSGGGEYSRTFDVKANGRTLLDGFDIYSDAGGSNIADTRVFKDISPDKDGLLRLDFHSGRAPALINTIEILPAFPHRLNPIRLVAQENFVTLSNGTVWYPDTFVSGGQLAGHSAQVTGTADQDLYSRERFGHFDYAIPVDSGTYSLSLYFAEEYFGPGNAGGGSGMGSRIFDVFCNGTFLLKNFDIFKEAGRNRALVKTFHGLTPNPQGKLDISFVPVRNYSSLYAIEVVDESQ